MMRYNIRTSGQGERAFEFLNEDCDFPITFNETTPQELADILVLHTIATLQEGPCVGDTVWTCDVPYTTTATGFEVLHVLKELGHCCLSFPGSIWTLRLGNIELKGPVFAENYLCKGGRLQTLQKTILSSEESMND